MVIFSNAKVNLGLQVLDKRSDGYHNLETVFYPIPLFDVIEIVENKGEVPGQCKLFTTGLTVPGEIQHNLCFKAYHLLNQDFDLPAIDIYLHKIIPFGAGLGGGSSNGAHVLKGLNKQFELGLNTIQLQQYALKLGADCPFFIKNEPTFAKGLGEIFENIELDLSGYSMILITPNIPISTKEAFGNLTGERKTKGLKEKIQNLSVENWQNEIFNDFQIALLKNIHAFKILVGEMEKTKPLYLSLSGTGSSFYAIYNKSSRENTKAIHSLKEFSSFNSCSFFEFDLKK